MTLYATDLTQLLTTIRATLAHKVGPGVSDSGARLELGMVIEQIDNLINRTAWSPTAVQRAVDLTEELAADLGLGGPSEQPSDSADPAETLTSRRREIEQRLRTTYSAGDAASIDATVAAVVKFSTTDIRDQISVGMREALPF